VRTNDRPARRSPEAPKKARPGSIVALPGSRQSPRVFFILSPPLRHAARQRLQTQASQRPRRHPRQPRRQDEARPLRRASPRSDVAKRDGSPLPSNGTEIFSLCSIQKNIPKHPCFPPSQSLRERADAKRPREGDKRKITSGTVRLFGCLALGRRVRRHAFLGGSFGSRRHRPTSSRLELPARGKALSQALRRHPGLQ
jgi:hypothetical protein